MTETSEIPEWKKSRWCVSRAYDSLIGEAVEEVMTVMKLYRKKCNLDW